MRAPQERTVRDLYDRTRLKDLALPEESSEGRASGRRVEGPGHREVVAAKMMESKLTSRKRPADSPIVKVESGTCNVCCSPCSSCLHRNIAITDSNMDCGSSQTCCARSETKNSSFLRSDKGLHGKGKGGENDDEFSATSSPASYTENGENKVVARSSVAADSEVDKPAKRRRLINHGSRSPRIECHDDSNSCVTGVSAAGKLLLDKKKDKLSMSASSRDLTVNCKDNSFNSQNRLRIFFIEESSGKKRSDVHVMNRSSSDRSLPAVSHSFATKKLLRTQSSLSASQGLCPKRPTHGSGNLQDNLAHQPCEKASSNKNIERSLGGKSDPSVLGAERHGTMTNCGTSSREKIKAGSLTKNIENGTSCLRIGSLERADIQSNDAVNRNDNDKQEQNQGCSMDTGNGRKLNMQNDVMTDSGNSEGLIDVNVCDICGDVGREYLLATCTRCLEGAEHTYCMRVKLEKVPDGEWLCEECHLKEEQNQTRSNDGAAKIKIFDGKNQNSETMNNPKTLKVATTDLDSGTPVTDPLSGRNQKLHLLSTDAEARQVKCTTPTAERLDGKNKNSGIMVNRKKLQVTTSGFEARHSTCSTPTSGNLDKNQSFDKKSQGSEALLNHKKLRIATDMESPLSNEGVRSPPKSFKRYAENTLSSTPRLLKTESPRKHDVLSRENSFKSSNKGSLKSPDNIPTRTPSVSSSMALPRSYSVGNLANVKKPVPSPRGLLSKQPSFNNSNNEPKVKQLAEPVVSKLKPSKHSPRDPREKGPIRKIMKSGSFKHEASVCKDSSSSKQKQSVHSSQNEKPRIVKPVKPTNLLERRASFNLQKPSIPSSPRSDSSTRTADPRNDQDNPRPGPSILKSSKKTGLVKKKHSSILSKSEKQGITDHPTSTGVVSSKGTYVVKASDPLIPVDKIENDSTDDACETPLVLVNNDNEMVIKPEVVSMPCAPVICGSDLQDIVSTSCSEEVQYEQKHLERSESGFSRSAVAIQASEDILPDCPQGCLVPYNPDNPDSKLNDMNIKQQAFVDQSAASGSSFGALVIPEQTYIWQGTFEVSRPGNSEMYDGFQAHLSTCASPKVLEVVKQLPQRITFAEVPRHSSWPLHFKEVKPNEDNIALYFFAKDVESYERAYGKLLGNMLAGDLSLTANISGIELLIFTSDKLPEKTQRWNGLLFFWGVFYAKKENSSTELLVKGMDPLELNGPVNRLVCSPNMPQSLGIDLNECPVDDFCDSAVSVEVKIKNSGASVDHEAERHSCEIHRPETACTGNILLGTPTAVPYGVHVHTGSKGECLNIKPEYQSDTQGGKRAAGRDMEEEESYYKNKAPCFAKQHTVASRSVSDEILANTQSPVSFKEVSLRHSVGPKLSEDPSDLILKRDFVLSDSSSMYKRQKTSDGKYSACTFGDGQLTSKYLSKIHPLPADQHMSLNDAQYICRVPADPCSPTKSNSDHIIHVLSSDDEDFLERRNTLNKASLKKEEGTSPLLSLSLSMASKKHNLAGSDTGDDGPLSLSLGLPGVVVSNQALEMKQFLPEKPGMNTSLLL